MKGCSRKSSDGEDVARQELRARTLNERLLPKEQRLTCHGGVLSLVFPSMKGCSRKSSDVFVPEMYSAGATPQ